jgi:hypothetical protein
MQEKLNKGMESLKKTKNQIETLGIKFLKPNRKYG